MKEVKTIMLAGVGGQGIIFAARLLSAGLIKAGFDVRSSEIHGMAQRGGSVVTMIRYGEKVYSPLVGPGAVDYLLATEKMEALRYAHFLKKGGLLLVNEREIPSLPVLTGAAPYPHEAIERLRQLPVRLVSLAAEERAQEVGGVRFANTVLVGAFVKLAGLAELVDWHEVISSEVRPEFAEANCRAFDLGARLV